jgi:hypothetical protein
MSTTFDVSVLDWIVKRWSELLGPTRHAAFNAEYDSLKRQLKESAPEFQPMRDFMAKLIRAALLDHSQAWPLVNALLQAIADQQTQSWKMDEALGELELIEYLEQWRSRYENNEKLTRRLEEIRRITRQMTADEGRLEAYKANILNLQDGASKMTETVEASWQRAHSDLTKLGCELNGLLKYGWQTKQKQPKKGK